MRPGSNIQLDPQGIHPSIYVHFVIGYSQCGLQGLVDHDVHDFPSGDGGVPELRLKEGRKNAYWLIDKRY